MALGVGIFFMECLFVIDPLEIFLHSPFYQPKQTIMFFGWHEGRRAVLSMDSFWFETFLVTSFSTPSGIPMDTNKYVASIPAQGPFLLYFHPLLRHVVGHCFLGTY